MGLAEDYIELEKRCRSLEKQLDVRNAEVWLVIHSMRTIRCFLTKKFSRDSIWGRRSLFTGNCAIPKLIFSPHSSMFLDGYTPRICRVGCSSMVRCPKSQTFELESRTVEGVHEFFNLHRVAGWRMDGGWRLKPIVDDTSRKCPYRNFFSVANGFSFWNLGPPPWMTPWGVWEG